MRFSYRIVHDRGGFVAECVESDAAGEGRTVKEAVASLRSALEERMFRPDAVAPPSEESKDAIELVLAEEAAEPPSLETPP